MSAIAKDPVFKPDTSFEVATEQLTEKQTIIHCNVREASHIRIWPTTFLIQDNGERKCLLHAYNIAAYPQWKLVNDDHCFTLVFEALDKNCVLFDLLEDITEPGAFKARNIRRNKSDVYNLMI